MQTFLAIILIFLLYLFASFVLHQYIVKCKSPIVVFLFPIFYIAGTYYYFELVFRIHHKLRENNIFLEFGHADIVLLEIMFVCFLLTIINIVVIFLRR